MDGKADMSCIVVFATRLKISLFVLHMTHDQSCINPVEWAGAQRAQSAEEVRGLCYLGHHRTEKTQDH